MGLGSGEGDTDDMTNHSVIFSEAAAREGIRILKPNPYLQFDKVIDEALTEAAGKKNWNEAFRRAVADRGIALVENYNPEGIPVESWSAAPLCIASQSGGWPRKTVLIFNPDFKRKRPR
jgi:hypothetical protein